MPSQGFRLVMGAEEGAAARSSRSLSTGSMAGGLSDENKV